MEKYILEDLDVLSEYRANLLVQSKSAGLSDNTRANLLMRYITTLPVIDRRRFLEGLDSSAARILASHCPSELRQICLTELDFLRRIPRLLNKYSKATDVFLLGFSTSPGSKDKAFRLAIESQNLNTFLFACDVFSQPANAAAAIGRDERATTEQALFAIRQNAERANIKSIINLYLELKKQERLNIEIVSEILLSVRLINKNHEIIPKLVASYNEHQSLNSQRESNVDDIDLALLQNDAPRSLEEALHISGIATQEALIAAAVERLTPDLFNSIGKIFSDQRAHDAIHSFALQRLRKHPNSFAAASLLINTLKKAGKISLCVGLSDRLSLSHPYNYHVEYTRAFFRAQLGDWSSLTKHFTDYFSVRKFMVSDRALWAINFMYAVDACPGISFQKKLEIYSDASESKKLRTPLLKPHLSQPPIALVGGDFRAHAMAPILKRLAGNLASIAPVKILSTSPTTLDDDTTQFFKDRYEFISLLADEPIEGAREALGEVGCAVDVAQYTEFNGLNWFRRGLAKVQASTYWASGYLTTEHCFDRMVVDEYSFSPLSGATVAPHTAELMFMPGGQALLPTQQLQWKAPATPNQLCLGVFVRPMRYSADLFSILGRILALGLVDTILFSHPHLEDLDNQKYVRGLLKNYGVDDDKVIISGARLSNDIKSVHFALDSFPVGSPTTSRDLLTAGVPVLIYEGKDVFSRLSPAFAYYAGLSDLIWSEETELIECIQRITLNGIFSVEIDHNKLDRWIDKGDQYISRSFKELLGED